jgi:hypothetical protein
MGLTSPVKAEFETFPFDPGCSLGSIIEWVCMNAGLMLIDHDAS